MTFIKSATKGFYLMKKMILFTLCLFTFKVFATVTIDAWDGNTASYMINASGKVTTVGATYNPTFLFLPLQISYTTELILKVPKITG